MQYFETSQWVPYPVELVFGFFANPANLPGLMPAKLNARIEDVRYQPPPPRPLSADPARRFKCLAAGAGSEILISFTPLRWIPVRVSWLARIVEFAWNSHFIDEQVHGPFTRFRHRHGTSAGFRNGAEGTLVSDSIEYGLPGGIAGAIASRQIRKQMEQSFEFRQRLLPEMLAALARRAAERS